MGYAYFYGGYMNAAYFDSTLEPNATSQSGILHMPVIEPFLVVAVAIFWLVALPFVAVSLACVGVWDTLVALKSSKAASPNQLILRHRRPPEGALVLLGSRAVGANHV